MNLALCRGITIYFILEWEIVLDFISVWGVGIDLIFGVRAENHLVPVCAMKLAWFIVWVVEIDLISVRGIELGLISD